jgi:hypothetical protein
VYNILIMSVTYDIHDNGGRPFRVAILNKKVTVSFKNYDIEDIDYVKFVTYYPKEILIGHSPKNNMTEFSGGYGEDFEGNSILLRIKNNTYVYIGSIIYSFNALNRIVKFESPVGGSDVPYPACSDEKGYKYLFVAKVILSPTNEIRQEYKDSDIYSYYYKHDLLTQDLGWTPPDEPVTNFKNIHKFYIGESEYTLRYTTHPKREFDRMLEDFKEDGVDEHGISILHHDNTKTQLTKELFVDMMKEYGELMGFQKLNIVMIHDRA